MPTWYSQGTVSLTNGSTAVAGSGTSWVAGLLAGWAFIGPNGLPIEIESVNSNTSLTLSTPYAGSTASGQAYRVMPTRGAEMGLERAIRDLISDYQAVVDGPGEGIFPGGTLALPGLRGAADTDTGLRWAGGNALDLVSGGASRARAHAGGLDVTGLLGGTAVTQSETDATAGRLLKVGDYGLGGLAPRIGNAGVTNNSIQPGLWHYNADTGSSGGPAGAVRGMLIHWRRAQGGGEAQLFVVEAGTGGAYPGGIFSRARGDTGWSDWIEAGAADAGSNGNGRFSRQAGNTQVCWHTVASSASAEVAWTFPAAFAATPTVLITPRTSGLVLVAPRLSARTPSSAEWSVFNSANARVSQPCDVMALGPWH